MSERMDQHTIVACPYVFNYMSAGEKRRERQMNRSLKSKYLVVNFVEDVHVDLYFVSWEIYALEGLFPDFIIIFLCLQ